MKVVYDESYSQWKDWNFERYNWFCFYAFLLNGNKSLVGLVGGIEMDLWDWSFLEIYVGCRNRRRVNSRQCGYANRPPPRNLANRSINRQNKLVFDNITVKMLAPEGTRRGQKRASHERPEGGPGRRGSLRTKEPSARSNGSALCHSRVL